MGREWRSIRFRSRASTHTRWGCIVRADTPTKSRGWHHVVWCHQCVPRAATLGGRRSPRPSPVGSAPGHVSAASAPRQHHVSTTPAPRQHSAPGRHQPACGQHTASTRPSRPHPPEHVSGEQASSSRALERHCTSGARADLEGEHAVLALLLGLALEPLGCVVPARQHRQPSVTTGGAGRGFHEDSAHSIRNGRLRHAGPHSRRATGNRAGFPQLAAHGRKDSERRRRVPARRASSTQNMLQVNAPRTRATRTRTRHAHALGEAGEPVLVGLAGLECSKFEQLLPLFALGKVRPFTQYLNDGVPSIANSNSWKKKGGACMKGRKCIFLSTHAPFTFKMVDKPHWYIVVAIEHHRHQAAMHNR